MRPSCTKQGPGKGGRRSQPGLSALSLGEGVAARRLRRGLYVAYDPLDGFERLDVEGGTPPRSAHLPSHHEEEEHQPPVRYTPATGHAAQRPALRRPLGREPWEERGGATVIAGFPRILCPLLAAVILCLPPAVFWPVGDAWGQPLSQDPLSCPAGSPPGSQVVSGLLQNLIPALNTQWSTQAPKSIDPYPWYDVTQPPNPLPLLDLTGDNAVQVGCHPPGGGDTDSFCLSKGWLQCSSSHINLQLQSLKGLGALEFQFGSTTPTHFKNVAAHSDRGPDGSRITDGVFA